MHTFAIISILKINTLNLCSTEIQYLLYHKEGWLILGRKSILTPSVLTKSKETGKDPLLKEDLLKFLVLGKYTLSA